MKRLRADTGSSGNGPGTAASGCYAVVTQLEGRERSFRASAQWEGVLPFIVMNARVRTNPPGTPPRSLRRRGERGPGSWVCRAEAFVSFTAAHKRSSFPGGSGPSEPGQEDKEVCI